MDFWTFFVTMSSTVVVRVTSLDSAAESTHDLNTVCERHGDIQLGVVISLTSYTKALAQRAMLRGLLTPLMLLMPLMPTTPAPRIQTTPAVSPKAKATAANNQGTRISHGFHSHRFGF